MARALADRGYASLLGNGRDHDVGAVLGWIDHPPGGRRPYEPQLGGTAWEVLTESPRDQVAWIDALAGVGFARVVLFGRSSGTVRVVSYQAERQDPRVAGLILGSPPMNPRFDIRRYPDATALARRLVAEGRADELLPAARLGLPWSVVSARTFQSRAPAHFDVFFGWTTPDPAIARVRCPILAFCGTDEEMVLAATDLETIRRSAKACPRIETRVLDGADHGYSGLEAAVVATIGDWLDALTAA